MLIGFDAKRLYHNRTGLGNYSRDLLRILSERYLGSNFILFNPKPAKIDFPSSKNLKEVRPKGLWNIFSSIWRLSPILKQVREEKIDLYHGLSGELPVGIGVLGIKSVVTIHDLIFLRFPKLYSPIDRRIYTAKAAYASKIADNIVAISEQTKQDIVSFFGIPEHKIKVIYQGCNPIFKTSISFEERQNILKKYGVEGNYILNVGTVEERKNALTIAKAIESLNTKLVIIGKKTSYAQKIEDFAKKARISDKIVFLSKLSLYEIACFYQSAKVFVYPSIFEGFGIPIIEAIYSKTPVVAAKGSCLEEAGGKSTLYIEPYDHKTLSEYILKLLNDDKLRKEQISKSLDFAQQHFDDEVIANSYNQLYRDVIAKKP